MIDLSLHALLPHRGAMLLLSRVMEVDQRSARSEVTISDRNAFFETGRGVPAWVGMEMMGQTAALIAGYQLQTGDLEPHVGLFLGTRRFQCSTPWFVENSVLTVHCVEKAVSQGALATFDCTIADLTSSGASLAEAVLSVYRQPIRS